MNKKELIRKVFFAAVCIVLIGVIGSKEQTSEGQMWKYLDSFTVK